MSNQQVKQTNKVDLEIEAGRDVSVGNINVEGNINAGGDVHKTVIHGQYNYQGYTAEEVQALIVTLKNADQAEVWDGRNPYLGLNAFQEKDAEFFNGREELVSELLQRIHDGTTFIAITGPSGSGKSSVARAGLFHALRTGKIAGSENWLLATMKPHGSPIEQLARAAENATKSIPTGDAIRQDPHIFMRQIGTHLDTEEQRFVLLVDQFEEIFTQTKDPAVRATFINLLTEAVAQPENRITVLISIRSDFISHCTVHPELPPLISKAMQLVGPMTPADLTKAITLPALAVGAEIDAALVSTVINDMKGAPDALPLMSFAMREMFEAEKTKKGEPMDLTLAEYTERGGLSEALERHANLVFADFSDDSKTVAEKIFARLIEVGKNGVDTRRTATMSELLSQGPAADVHNIVNSFAADNVRLISTSGQADSQDASVSIAHERLIEAWPWLRELIDSRRESIRIENEISEVAREWQANQQDPGYLYRSGKLEHAQEWLASGNQLQGLAADFIEASKEAVREAIRKEEEQRQKELQHERDLAEKQKNLAAAQKARADDAEKATAVQKRLTQIAYSILGVALIAAVLAGIFGIRARINANEANTQRNIAVANEEEANNQRNIAQANEEEANEQRNIAQANAEEANEQRNIAEANAEEANTQRNIAQANAAEAVTQSMIATAQNLQSDSKLLFSTLLATGAYERNSSIAAENILRQNLVKLPIPVDMAREQGGRINQISFSADGRWLASASSNQTAIIWDTVTGEILDTLHHADTVETVKFSPYDNNTLVTADFTEAHLWQLNLDTGEHVSVTLASEWVIDIDFSPDRASNQFATSSASDFDASVRIWDATTGAEIQQLQHPEWVSAADYTPDAQQLISVGGADVQIWDIPSNRATTIRPHGPYSYDIAIHPTRDLFASVGNDKTLRIWNSTSEEPERVFYHENTVLFVEFSPDGKWLSSASEDNKFRIWDTETWQESQLYHDARLATLNISPDSLWAASISLDQTARIWNLQTKQEVAIIHLDGPGSAVLFNHDGTKLATGTSNGQVQIWDLTQLPREQSQLFHGDLVRDALFSPQGDYFVTVSNDNVVRRWPISSLEEPSLTIDQASEPLREIGSLSRGVAINQADTLMAIAYANNLIIERLTDGVVSFEFTVGQSAFGDAFTSLSFSRDDGKLIAGNRNGNAYIWNLADGTHLELSHEGIRVDAVAYHPDGDFVATGINQGGQNIYIWNPKSGEQLKNFSGADGNITDMIYSQDGQWFAAASGDGVVRVWETSALHDPNNTAPAPKFELLHDKAIIDAITFSPDSNILVSASKDQLVRFWDSATGREVARLPHGNDIRDLSFSQDGTWLLTANGDVASAWQVANIAQFATADLNTAACNRLSRNLTADEWQQFNPYEPYRLICADRPDPTTSP